eukprot:TRINITY_DN23174_c0_g1_i1.p1 TRINITY_DN23174_c0_g1~~TRINITY_DN23174_c0_g1_i1.p1  ORF type:complete len:450 (+),score=117.72 TRINITY_DN23174_c0_g1_i1:56-1405(+)
MPSQKKKKTKAVPNDGSPCQGVSHPIVPPLGSLPEPSLTSPHAAEQLAPAAAARVPELLSARTPRTSARGSCVQTPRMPASGAPASRESAGTALSIASAGDEDIEKPASMSGGLEQLSYFIGDDISSPGAAGEAAEVRTAIKGVCAEYFECHISPVLRFVQQAQEQFNCQLRDFRTALDHKTEAQEQFSRQLSDLRIALDRKAEADTVLSRQSIVEIVAGEASRRSEHNGVSTLVKLQELSAAVQRKADAALVPTMTQLKALSALVEQKANAKDVASTTAQVDELAKMRAAGGESNDFTALRQRVDELARTLQQKAEGQESKDQLRVLVAAAGARFDRQLRDLKQKIHELQKESREERWPGRVLGGGGPGSDAGSDAPSMPDSVAGSLTGSIAGSTYGPEERAELRKIQAVVGAAGTAFTRDLRELRRQVQECKGELMKLKEHSQHVGG